MCLHCSDEHFASHAHVESVKISFSTPLIFKMAKSAEIDTIWEEGHEEPMKTSTYGSINNSVSFHQESLENVDIAQKKWTRVFFAYALCVASMILACASIACVQVLAGAVPEFELNAWRFGANLMIITPVTLFRKCDVRVPKAKLPYLIVLFFTANIFNITYYESAVYLPVGTVFAVSNSVVIIGNALLSICIKSERKLPLYIGAVVVVIGLFMITQPPFMFPGDILPSAPAINWTSPCITAIETEASRNVSTMPSMDGDTDKI